MSKIHWNETERAAVLNGVLAFMRENNTRVESIVDTPIFTEATESAQKNLPQWRRRTIAHHTHAPWIVEAVRKEYLAKNILSTPELSFEQVQHIVAANLDVVLKVLSSTHVVVPKTDMVHRQVHRGHAVKPKMLKVFVVGLLPSQATEIMALWGRDISLRFLNSDEGNKAAFPNADYAIAMSSFTSHSLMNLVVRNWGTRCIVTHGGISSLEKILQELLDADRLHQST